MKQLVTLVLTLMMLLCAPGISTSTHFCNNEYVSGVVNGIHLGAKHSHAMNCCKDKGGKGCKKCKTIHHEYRLNLEVNHSQIGQANLLSLIPDCFHALLPTVLTLPQFEEEEQNPESFYRPPNGYDGPLPHSSLRAPPTLTSRERRV